MPIQSMPRFSASKSRIRTAKLPAISAKYLESPLHRKSGNKRKHRPQNNDIEPHLSFTTSEASHTRIIKRLETALRQYDFEEILWLIENDGLDPNQETAYGETPLLAAVSCRNNIALDQLIKSGATINDCNRSGCTPLMKAIAEARILKMDDTGHSKKVTSDIGRKIKTLTSLHAADAFDNSMVEYVLSYEPNLELRDSKGKTALRWAELTGNDAIIKVIQERLQSKRKINADSAWWQTQVDKSRQILANNEHCIEELKPILASPLLDEVAMMSILNSAPLSIDEYQEALEVLEQEHCEDALVYDFFVDYESNLGWTPLTKAAANNSIVAADKLLAMGADMYKETKLKHTAMTWACFCGHDAMCLYFLRAGVDVNYQTNEKKTALIHAVSNSQKSIVKYLLKALKDNSVPDHFPMSFQHEVNASEAMKAAQTARLRPGTSCNTSRSVGRNRDKLTSRSQSSTGSAKHSEWLEWHEKCLTALLSKSGDGLSAIEYAETIMAKETDVEKRGAAEEVLKDLNLTYESAKKHQEYVQLHGNLTQPKSCKHQGCDFIASADAINIHEEHHCPKRTILCERCEQEVIAELESFHLGASCPARKVMCPNVDAGCKELVPLRDRSFHVKYHCRKRHVSCRLNCGVSVTFDSLHEHESKECPYRTIDCPNFCGEQVAANERKLHLKKRCSKRLVECERGCGQMVVYEQMSFHCTEKCTYRPIPCKWTAIGCKSVLKGSTHARQHHEEHTCPYKLCDCRNGCDLSGILPFCALDNHYAHHCDLQIINCPGACSEELSVQAADTHLLSDIGNCPKRQVHCPLDLCERTVKVWDINDTSVAPVLKSVRAADKRWQRHHEYLESLLMFEEDVRENLRSDLSICMSSTLTRKYLISCFENFCLKLLYEATECKRKSEQVSKIGFILSYSQTSGEHLVRFGNSVERINLHKFEHEILDKGIDFQCSYILSEEEDHHLLSTCLLRTTFCPLGCGMQVLSKSIQAHIATGCEERNIYCSLGCGTLLPQKHLRTHEEGNCDYRDICCPHCHDSILARDLKNHIKEDCQKYPHRCQLGCGALVAKSDRPLHESKSCPKRTIPCEKCSELIIADTQARHLASDCRKRVVGECPIIGCKQSLTFEELEDHVNNKCLQRIVNCSKCQTQIVAKKVNEHKKFSCPERIVRCSQGCGLHIRACEVTDHESNSCLRRLLYCPLRCGSQIPLMHVDDHVNKKCTLRLIQCSTGCSESIFAYEEDTHWKRCRQRIVNCGFGSGDNRCGRPLALWIVDRRLAKCVRHHASALERALTDHDEDLVSYLFQQLEDKVSASNEEFMNGFSPLTTAVSVNDMQSVEILLQYGADVNLETSRGRTPLREAVTSGNVDLVALLLSHRAKADHVNRHGECTLEVAKELAADRNKLPYEHQLDREKIVKLLEQQLQTEQDLEHLFRAIACSDYDYVSSLFRYSNSLDTAVDALAMEQRLRQACEKAEQQTEKAQKNWEDSICACSDSLTATEEQSVQVEELRRELANTNSQIRRVDGSRDILDAESSALENRMLETIRSFTTQDIAALVNVHVPTPTVLVITKALCLLTGVLPRGRRNATEYTDREWWNASQALLMDRSLLQKLRAYRRQPTALDVMTKVRRECFRSPDFLSISKYVSAFTLEPGSDTTQFVASATVLEKLALWINGVDREYNINVERDSIGDKMKKLQAVAADLQKRLQQAEFDLDISRRSLPSRQEEVHSCRSELENAKKALEIAKQRLKAHTLVNSVALNGHTPMTLACSVGNEGMVHLLLASGGSCGYTPEERSLCASLLQLSIKAWLKRRKEAAGGSTGSSDLSRHPGLSDKSMSLLIDSIAQSFLIGHIQRRLAFLRQTRRVPLHEAVMSGYSDVVTLLLEHGARLWQKTHVVPQCNIPCPLSIANSEDVITSQNNSCHLHGWVLQPLDGSEGKEPMTVSDTLELALDRFDCSDFQPSNGGWHESKYQPMREVIEQAYGDWNERKSQLSVKIAARKRVEEQMRERKELHDKLDTAIAARLFEEITQLLDEKASADYTTQDGEISPLMAAAIEEAYTKDADGNQMLMIDLLLDRKANRPVVDFESKCGNTALRIAAFHGSLRAIEALLEHGADVNRASAADGRTPLMVATANHQLEAVRLLVRHSTIDLNVVDSKNMTALDIARQVSNGEIADLLTQVRGGRSMYCVGREKVGHRLCRWGCGYSTREVDHQVGDDDDITGQFLPLQKHEREECMKRPVVCSLGCPIEGLWAEELKHHTQFDCPKRGVKCPIHISCDDVIAAESLNFHMEKECAHRTVHCVCGATMLGAKYPEHLESKCPKRLISCPLECLDPATNTVSFIQACDSADHQKYECPNGTVRCRNGCPETGLLRCLRDDHEQEVCPLRRVDCANGCKETVIAKHRLVHETQECELRRVPCPNKCGIKHIFYCQVQEHVEKACKRRLVPCPLQCGLNISLHTLESHMKDHCAKRHAKCESCGKEMRGENLYRHRREECSARLVSCVLCGEKDIVQTDLSKHREQSCPMRRVKCSHRCMSTLAAHELKRHEEHECNLRLIYCPLGCGEVMTAQANLRHVKVCGMRIVECGNGCGLECRAKDKESHELNYCFLRRKN